MTDDAVRSEAVVVERSFDAPVELIWKMWTDPEHFQAWYGPDGATIPIANFDLRVGGLRHICMEVQTPSGARRMWFAGEHRELVEHERLVYTEAISDEHANLPTPAAASADPSLALTEVRVEFEQLGDRSKIVMTHVGVPSDSPGAAGWNMAFAKLTAYVEAQTV